jgi:hypothetical protein
LSCLEKCQNNERSIKQGTGNNIHRKDPETNNYYTMNNVVVVGPFLTIPEKEGDHGCHAMDHDLTGPS